MLANANPNITRYFTCFAVMLALSLEFVLDSVATGSGCLLTIVNYIFKLT